MIGGLQKRAKRLNGVNLYLVSKIACNSLNSLVFVFVCLRRKHNSLTSCFIRLIAHNPLPEGRNVKGNYSMGIYPSCNVTLS